MRLALLQLMLEKRAESFLSVAARSRRQRRRCYRPRQQAAMQTPLQALCRQQERRKITKYPSLSVSACLCMKLCVCECVYITTIATTQRRDAATVLPAFLG